MSTEADPNRMGQTVINTMQRVLNGETIPEILLTPSAVVTPENLQDYLNLGFLPA